MSALDLATSSSLGEGFSNAIAEAMACGVPCVVTDVGDSAHIVGDTGVVVPAADPQALAAAWQQILDLPSERRRDLGHAARRRIEEKFDLVSMIDRYHQVYREVAERRGRRG